MMLRNTAERHGALARRCRRVSLARNAAPHADGRTNVPRVAAAFRAAWRRVVGVAAPTAVA